MKLYDDFQHRLVSGAGDIKLTKDGNVLLHEMVRLCGYFTVRIILGCVSGGMKYSFVTEDKLLEHTNISSVRLRM